MFNNIRPSANSVARHLFSAGIRRLGSFYSLFVFTLVVLQSHPTPLVAQTAPETGGRIVLQLGHTGTVRVARFGPDGRLLATAGEDGQILLWNLRHGKIVQILRGHGSSVDALAFSSDGAQLLSGGQDGIVRLWNVRSGEQLRQLTGLDAYVHQVAFLPDGRQAVASGLHHPAIVWDLATGNTVRRFDREQNSASQMAVSAAGDLLAIGFEGKTVKVWSLGDGQLRHTFEDKSVKGDDNWRAKIDQLGFARDGQQLVAVGNDGAGRVWSTGEGRLVRQWAKPAGDWQEHVLSPDAQRLVLRRSTYDDSPPLGFIDLSKQSAGDPVVPKLAKPESASDGSSSASTSAPLPSTIEPERLEIDTLAVSPDGSQIALATKTGIQMVDAVAWRLRRRLKIPGVLMPQVRRVAAAPDGKLFAVAVGDSGFAIESQPVHLFDAATGARLRQIDVPAGGSAIGIDGLEFSSDGTLLAMTGSDGVVRFADVATGRIGKKIAEAKPKEKFSDDGVKGAALAGPKLILTWTSKAVTIWDVTTGKQLRKLQGDSKSVSAVAASADARQAIVISEGKARLFDVTSGRPLKSLPDATSYGGWQSAQFSPNSLQVLLVDQDLSFKLFETATGNIVSTYSAPERGGYSSDPKGCLAFAGQGRQILVASHLGQIVRIDLENGRPRGAGSGLAGIPISQCVFTADGQRIVTADTGGGVSLRSSETMVPIVTMLAGRQEAWLSMTPEGLFTGSETGQRSVILVRDLAPVEGDAWRPTFARAGLIKEHIAGDPEGRVRDWLRATDPAAAEARQGTTAAASKSDATVTPRFLGSAVAAPSIKALGNDDRSRIVANQSHAGSPSRMAFSPDGQQVVTIASDKVAKLWDVGSGRLLRTFEGADQDLNSVAYAPDGGVVAAGLDRGIVIIWNVATGQRVRRLETGLTKVAVIAYSPDGKWLVAGAQSNSSSESDKNLVQAFDTQTMRPSQKLLTGEHGPTALAFLRDGRHVAITLWDSVLIWDAISGETRKNYKSRESSIEHVAVSPDGELLASVQGRSVSLWDVHGGLIRIIEMANDFLAGAAFSADGKLVYSGGREGRLYGWDVASGRLVHSVAAPGAKWIRVAALAPGGTQLVTIEGLMSLRDIASGSLVRTFGQNVSRIEQAAFLPGGQRIVVGDGPSIRMWDARQGTVARSFDGKKEYVGAVAVDKEGKHMMMAHPLRLTRVLDVKTGKILATMTDAVTPLTKEQKSDPIMSAVMTVQNDVYSRMHCAAFSPDGSLIAIGRNDGLVRLYDARAGKLLRTLKTGDGFISAMAFSPDGRTLATGGSDQLIRLWETGEGALVKTLTGHKWAVRALAFASDGQQLLSGGGDLMMLLWNLETGQVVKTIKAHDNVVRAVAISGDGRSALSGSYDTTVKLWDLSSGALLKTLSGHTSEVNSVAFSADDGERRAISTSSDGTTKIWSLPDGRPLATFLTSGEGNWIAMTPEGFFNASSPEAAATLSIVKGRETTGVDQLYQSLFNPDLVRDKLEGSAEAEAGVAAAAKVLDLEKVLASGKPPTVTMLAPNSNARSDKEVIAAKARITDAGGGIGRVEWRLNGITVGVDSVDATKPGGIDLERSLALDAGDNKIEVIAYNKVNLLSSAPARASLTWNGGETAQKPSLYVLAIGIDRYQDQGYLDPAKPDRRIAFPRLTLAVKDAKAFGVAIKAAGQSYYKAVNVRPLLDEQATGAGLEAAIKSIADEIQPRDVFILFVAAHGASEDGRFYLIPQDYSADGPGQLSRRAIGQERFQDWIVNRIKAKKALILLDTCESGALVGGYAMVHSGSAASEAAVGRLHEATGRPVLTAAAAGKDAVEGRVTSSGERHGVFTYALIDALKNADSTGIGNGNGLIELRELAAHVQDLVPKLSATIDLGEGRASVTQKPRLGSRGEDFVIAARLRQ